MPQPSHDDQSVFINIGMRLHDLLETAIDERSFRKWFSGSKVIDAHGKPLLCFHGTHANHEIKPGGHQHFGTFQAANDRIKDLYDLIANHAHEVYRAGHASQPAVYPVYLAIKNPLVLADSDWADSDVIMDMFDQGLVDIETVERSQEGTEDWITIAKRLGYDGMRYRNDWEDANSYSWYPFDDHQVWNFFADRPY